MNEGEFLTESQTLAYAGIDRNILTRFCETGYIKTKLLSNGQVLYSKSEIERIFGKRREALSNQVENSDISSLDNYEDSQTSRIHAQNVSGDIKQMSDKRSCGNQSYAKPSDIDNSNKNQVFSHQKHEQQEQKTRVSRLIKFPESAKASISDLFSDLNDMSSQQSNNVFQSQAPKSDSILESESKNTATFIDNYAHLENGFDSSDVNTNSNRLKEQEVNINSQNSNQQTRFINLDNNELAYKKKLEQENETLRQEIVKLQSYARLQKKLLEVKEKEIGELKQEKDWFKNRIETQEEKNNRDQLLILSETRVIHNLISNAQKISPFRAALEWLGFSKKENQETIDMAK